MSGEIETIVPVGGVPVESPVISSPTTKVPVGTGTTNSVFEVRVLIVVLAPLVPPVMV